MIVKSESRFDDFFSGNYRTDFIEIFDTFYWCKIKLKTNYGISWFIPHPSTVQPLKISTFKKSCWLIDSSGPILCIGNKKKWEIFIICVSVAWFKEKLISKKIAWWWIFNCFEWKFSADLQLWIKTKENVKKILRLTTAVM